MGCAFTRQDIALTFTMSSSLPQVAAAVELAIRDFLLDLLGVVLCLAELLFLCKSLWPKRFFFVQSLWPKRFFFVQKSVAKTLLFCAKAISLSRRSAGFPAGAQKGSRPLPPTGGGGVLHWGLIRKNRPRFWPSKSSVAKIAGGGYALAAR